MTTIQTAFEDQLRADGFVEIAERERGETPTNEFHSHAFDARILVLEGSFGLTRNGESEPTFYQPGQSFTVPAGCVHAETYPAGGTRWMFGTRPAS